MAENKVFELADMALNSVVQQIKDDQWSLEIPSWFKLGRKQDDMTLRTIVNYHAFDDAWVPDILSGKSMDEAGKDKFGGDLLGDNPRASFAAICQKACAAARDDYDPERIAHLSYGDYKSQEYLQHITLFRYFRIYDISKLIGVEPDICDELVEGMWDQFVPHADEYRKMGVIDPEIKVANGASTEDKLLGLAGRQPLG